MSRMRVCEVVKTLNVGGTEILLVERLQRAPKRDKDYTVVCLQASTGELIARLKACGVTVVDLTACPRPLMYLRMVTTVRRLSPDVLNVHSPLAGTVLRVILRLYRKRPRLVSTVHSVYVPTPAVSDRVTTSLSMLIDRLTRGLDDQTVAVSSLVARSSGVRGARRLATRVHGVDVAEQKFWSARSGVLRREFGVPAGRFLMVCVANLRAPKNHRLLIQAAAEIMKERPDAILLLAGDGPLRKEIVNDIRRRGIGDHVRVLGSVPHARRLVAAADLLVLSSHYEGLPVVIMEALAAGVPVVSTKVGGIPDVVTSGVNGILTEPGSAEALTAGIRTAMDPATHRRLCAGAMAGAETLDIAGTAEWFEDLYDELTAKA
jgi:glycosyltransferase involved in cell wall biosynthesis